MNTAVIVRHHAVNRTLGRTEQECWCRPERDGQNEIVHHYELDPHTLVQPYIKVSPRRTAALRKFLGESCRRGRKLIHCW